MIDLIKLKEECLVYDIECFSKFDIQKENERYVADAKVKWVGFYSFKTSKYYEIPVLSNELKIKDFISKHKILVGFNNDAFDNVIMKNNSLMPETFFNSVDLKTVLGNNLSDKKRGNLMGYSFRSNSLKEMSEAMNLESQKGLIDYSVFEKNSWTQEETELIKKYLRADIEVTKQMFDKVWDYWSPFTNFITEKNVKNLSWIKNSVGSLTYKWACNVLNVSEDYGDKSEYSEGGGLVKEPTVDEAWNIFYIDVVSMYPHSYCMFNLLAEVPAGTLDAFHGNELFKVKGYYDVSKRHKLCEEISLMLKKRVELKKINKNDPLVYTYKIILNTLYGINRSKIFKNVHTNNSGEDCCFLGRQINELMQKKGDELGYDTIAADTDSNFWKYRNGERTFIEVKQDLKKIVDLINANVPFPQETFNIDIEAVIDYIMFVPDAEGVNKKKNYCYVYTKKDGCKDVKVMGLPIKKVNASRLAPMIFEKFIKPRMIAELKGKFDSEWIKNLVHEELSNDLSLVSQEYKCNNYESYGMKGKHCLTAQISKAYLNGKAGIISLIKNDKFGKVGEGMKYCTITEAKQFITIKNLDLSKVFNELTPFTKSGFSIVKKNKSLMDY